jgi:hypothetical protein
MCAGEWIAADGAKTIYIERGWPCENGYREKFSNKLRETKPTIMCRPTLFPFAGNVLFLG